MPDSKNRSIYMIFVAFDLDSRIPHLHCYCFLLYFLQENLEEYTKWSSLALHLSATYYEIAVVGSNALSLTQELNSKFLVNTLVIGSETVSNIAIYKDRFENDKTYIYFCLNNSCKLPVTSVPGALQQIEYNVEKSNFNLGF